MNIDMAFISVGTVTKGQVLECMCNQVRIMNLLYPRVDT